MPCIDADGFPVAGHGCLVPAPLQLGAVERVLAEVEQREPQGFSGGGRQGFEPSGPGVLQIGVGAMNCGFGHGWEVQAQAGPKRAASRWRRAEAVSSRTSS